MYEKLEIQKKQQSIDLNREQTTLKIHYYFYKNKDIKH
jgi:hypothetical protein